MPRATPELDLLTAANQLLEWDGWRVIKMETIGKPEWGKGVGEKHMPDYLYIRYLTAPGAPIWSPAAEVLWIEWKAPKGKIDPGQTLWHEIERKRGALTAIAKRDFRPDIDSFTIWYRATGLCRRIR
jgi:hypothetical protein